MSRDLPSKPSLEYLRKQAKQLQRSMPNTKLAATQHSLANEYGFATWAKLKSHVIHQVLPANEALKLAVCDSEAQGVRDILKNHPELKAAIDDPLPNYGFGQHALFAAVQRSDRATIDVLLGAGADIRKRTEWWAGGFGVLDDCEMGATALHWAGFNGNAVMARGVLRFRPALELKSREYPGTALSWTLYASGNGGHRDTGDFVGTVRALLEAGAMLPRDAEALEPSDAVLEVLP